jgi:heme/copper-type cytochrome/quinol oxidase subunit 2
MTTIIIISYFVLGLLFYVTIWKRFEDEDSEFQNGSRFARIVTRIVIIVVWGLIVAAIIILGLCKIIRELWDSITE